MNWKAILRLLIAAVVSSIIAAAEQWVHNGKPIPSTPDQWREFGGVIGIAVLTGVYHLLQQNPFQPAAVAQPAPKENQ